MIDADLSWRRQEREEISDCRASPQVPTKCSQKERLRNAFPQSPPPPRRVGWWRYRGKWCGMNKQRVEEVGIICFYKKKKKDIKRNEWSSHLKLLHIRTFLFITDHSSRLYYVEGNGQKFSKVFHQMLKITKLLVYRNTKNNKFVSNFGITLNSISSVSCQL